MGGGDPLGVSKHHHLGVKPNGRRVESVERGLDAQRFKEEPGSPVEKMELEAHRRRYSRRTENMVQGRRSECHCCCNRTQT